MSFNRICPRTGTKRNATSARLPGTELHDEVNVPQENVSISENGPSGIEERFEDASDTILPEDSAFKLELKRREYIDELWDQYDYWRRGQRIKANFRVRYVQDRVTFHLGELLNCRRTEAGDYALRARRDFQRHIATRRLAFKTEDVEEGGNEADTEEASKGNVSPKDSQ